MQVGPLGTAENFKFGIQRLRIGAGQMLELTGPGTVVAVVGANNVGKSTVLQQLVQIFMHGDVNLLPDNPRVVTELGDMWTGTIDDCEAWIRANYQVTVDPAGRDIVTRLGQNTALNDMLSILAQSSTPRGYTQWFVNQQTSACARGSAVQPVDRPDNEPMLPLQLLAVDPDARNRVQTLAQRLFGIDLQIDAVSRYLTLRIGKPALAAPPADDQTLEYKNAVVALKGLHEQGDGYRTALGLLIPLVTDSFPLTLIDEPEAFLHPPQARVLGTEIGKLAKDNDSQIVLATHDKNILQGLVESETPVDVIHLTRTDDTTTAHHFKSADIEALWKDPVLRYGNALDALFHAAVIITEADRDSRFYEAAIGAARVAASPDSPVHNLMFFGSNGKQNMARIVSLLRQFNVRAVTCPDLDILDDKTVLRTLIQAHGGNWTDFEANYNKATNQFLGSPSAPTVAAVVAEVTHLLDGATGPLTDNLANQISDAIKLPKSKWKNLKDFGVEAFKDQKTAANELLDALDALGIVTVRKGVLENFLTTADARKGNEWLNVAFREGAHTTPAAIDQANRLLEAAGISAAPAAQ